VTPQEAKERRRRRAGRLGGAASLAMRILLRPLANRGRFRPGPPPRGGRRLLLVQLDGLSRTRLERAMAEGLMPSLASRVARGTHVLSACRSGAPATTPAFQAGLFYGRSPSVPSFIWYDRVTGREVRMDRAADAAALERALAAGTPGLLRGGTSYFSIFSGGAALPHFCLSGLAGEVGLDMLGDRLGPWDAAASALVHSVTAARSAYRLARELGAGLVEGTRWSATVGRIQHEPRFLIHRLWVAAVLRELAIQGILLDVSRGIPAIYADFLGFDEYGHRRGPESAAALRHLASADAALATVFGAVEAAPELGYDVYVLSDHGLVATRPFEAVAGIPLREFVARAELGEPLPRGPGPSRPNRALLGGRDLGVGKAAGIATVEAGGLAHVYFLREQGPLALDHVRARHWRVLAALSATPAVGLIAARGGRRGLALVRGAVLDLADPGDVARLPHPEPRLLAVYLSDLVSLADSGDLVVVGWRGERSEVVAYAWEFGSHGGVSPEELESFVLHPATCRFQFERVVRPSELYRFFEEHYRAPAERDRAGVADGAESLRAGPLAGAGSELDPG
jgi:hypothetical protein